MGNVSESAPATLRMFATNQFVHLKSLIMQSGAPSYADAAGALQLLSETGFWTDDQRDELVEAVCSRCDQASAAQVVDPAATGNKKVQTCGNFHNMMTDADWLVVTSPQSTLKKAIGAVVDRALTISLRHPGEPTEKQSARHRVCRLQHP